jgi:hypothetical protein
MSRHLKVIFLAFVFSIILYVSYVNEYLDYLKSFKNNNPGAKCTVVHLENIVTASLTPKANGKHIFFIETRQPENILMSLGSRQACSIESAGKIILH